MYLNDVEHNIYSENVRMDETHRWRSKQRKINCKAITDPNHVYYIYQALS